jgi:hypothetical protein
MAMREEDGSRGSYGVESGLEVLFGAPAPETAFVVALEQRLEDRAAQVNGSSARSRGQPAPWTAPLRRFGRQRWAMGALGLLLALMLTVTAIGPQQVWAGVQRFLASYVPGLAVGDGLQLHGRDLAGEH